MSYKGLGSVGGGETLSRRVAFINKEVMNRVVIKFSLAVESPNLSSYFSKQWMTFSLIDSTSSQIISTFNLIIQNLSSIRTTCGYIYTYQLAIDLNKEYSSFQVNFSASINFTWTLLSFDFSLGCRGLVASTGNLGSYHCDSCLSGYYPKYAVNNQVEECKACDYRCKACANFSTCLTCVENAHLDEKTGMCEFS